MRDRSEDVRIKSYIPSQLLGVYLVALPRRANGPTIVAMPGSPFKDIAVTEKVDFVMKAGRVYRYGPFDILQ
jgi:hypothetical protein